jgi:hypothetical protein
VLPTGKVRQREHQAIQYSECHRFDGSANDAIMGRSSGQAGDRVAMTLKETQVRSSAKEFTEDDSSFTWKELEERFQNVQMKAPERQKVSGWFTRTESHTGSVTEEWMVEGDPACRVEFEQLASIGARKLGYVLTEARTYWLSCVREWMIQEKLDRNGELAWLPTGFVDSNGHRSTTQHLYTERIAQLSAMFCVKLIADRTSESAVSAAQEVPSAAVKQPSSPKRKGKQQKSSTEVKRQEIIFAAIQEGLKGKSYCAKLDEHKVKPSKRWKTWPGTYLKAYTEFPLEIRNAWRKKIWNERNKHKDKLDS